MDSHRTWFARHTGWPGDRGTRRAAALDRLARPARNGRADLGSVVRSRVGARRAAISPASRPPGRRLSPHGPSGSRAQRSAGSAVQRSRIRGERRGTAAPAGSRGRGHGAPRGPRVAAGVLAAARPLVPLRGGGAHQPTAAVIILDNSPSSGAIVDGGLVLDRLRVAARSSLARTTSADRVWLMLCDGVLRGGTREALLVTIDSTHPGWLRLDLVRAVERASRMVNAQPLVGREVHVVSDGQRTALASSRD